MMSKITKCGDQNVGAYQTFYLNEFKKENVERHAIIRGGDEHCKEYFGYSN
jgi:hypothetical protein